MRAFLFLALPVIASCGASPTPRAHASSVPPSSSTSPPTAAAPTPDDDSDDAAPHRPVIAESLRRHEPWNDPLPRGALARLGTTRFQHGFAVAVAAPKGSILSGSTYYGILQRWDAKTGELLASGKIDGAETFEVAVATPDGKTVVFADSYSIFVVDTETLKVRMTKKFFDKDGDGSRIEDVAIHPDGRIAVGGCSKVNAEALRILDRGGNEIARPYVPPPKESYDEACASRVEFSPDGKLLAASVNGKATLYSFPEGAAQASFESGVAVEALAFSHDGTRLYVGGYGEAVNAFDTKTFKAVRSFGFFDYERDREVRAIAVSPDDRTVAIAARDVRLFDTSSGLDLGSLPGVGSGKAMTFPLPGVVAYPVADPTNVGRFDVAKREALGPLDLGRHDRDVKSGGFSPDGASVLTGADDGTIRRWNAKTGAPLATWAGDEAFGGTTAIAVVPQVGTVLSVGSSSNRLPAVCELLFHDAATLAVTARVPMPPAKDRGCSAVSVAVSHDGARAYVVTRTAATSFDLAKKTLHATAPIAAADEPRGRLFVTADGSLAYGAAEGVVFLDAEKLSKSREVKGDALRANMGDDVAISPDGRRAANVAGRDVAIVDLSNGKVVVTTALRRGGQVYAAEYSPDGTRIYAGYREDDTSGIVALDAATGKLVADLPRLHADADGNPVPRFIAVNADGSRILEGSSDTTALVLDASALRGGSQ